MTLIAENIETIEAHTNFISDIEDSKIINDVLEKLPIDGVIYVALISVMALKNPSQEVRNSCCALLKVLYQKGIPRVLFINDMALRFAKAECSSDSELRGMIDKARSAIVDNIKHKSPFSGPVWDDYELDGWVYTYEGA